MIIEETEVAFTIRACSLIFSSPFFLIKTLPGFTYYHANSGKLQEAKFPLIGQIKSPQKSTQKSSNSSAKNTTK